MPKGGVRPVAVDQISTMYWSTSRPEPTGTARYGTHNGARHTELVRKPPSQASHHQGTLVMKNKGRR
jgi:hypothetical protein